jgi:hypothetical protein
VEVAMELFRRAGSLEGETRVKLVLADFRDLVGDRGAAKELAEEALGVAVAMSYSRLESHAREYTEGPTPLSSGSWATWRHEGRKTKTCSARTIPTRN